MSSRFPRNASPPWQNLPAWCVLDTAWGDGTRFLSAWQSWQRDAQRPRMLHYVAICEQAPDIESLQRSINLFPELRAHARSLTRQWFGLLPGFHRIHLSAGHLLLTLCIGELKTILREQHFTADSVFLGAYTAPSESAHWALKAVARCCRRGTALVSGDVNENLRDDLARLGFEFDSQSNDDYMEGVFNPRWDLKNSRGGRPVTAALATPPGNCVVIGAGLAGASIAASLARRGWKVQVLDAANAPAAGASGLPAGLAVPHNSPDNSPRSRLSRAGLRLTLEQARTVLTPGQDFEECGTLERRLDGALGLPGNWTMAGREWSCEIINTINAAADVALWHGHGAWIKPTKLVKAWLSEPGVRFVPNAQVKNLALSPKGWELTGDAGQSLATAHLVVMAAAGGSLALLRNLRPDTTDIPVDRINSMGELGGQVSWGLHQPGDAAEFPETPVNGSGSFIPAVPQPDGLAWFAGATYEPLGSPYHQKASVQTQHQENLRKLDVLLPYCAARLQPRFKDGDIQEWSGVRCATADRLPVVDVIQIGAAQAGTPVCLGVSTAMGSRGLSLCVLCAELLAARLHAEPLPVESRLARLLQA
ncbi:MAG TPA: FAD-dependent oxidoreductase [Burkholderiaceae bacterium]|nr:FAD-dependent oxidoreductase [Burkholderiaceae bacterium]